MFTGAPGYHYHHHQRALIGSLKNKEVRVCNRSQYVYRNLVGKCASETQTQMVDSYQNTTCIFSWLRRRYPGYFSRLWRWIIFSLLRRRILPSRIAQKWFWEIERDSPRENWRHPTVRSVPTPYVRQVGLWKFEFIYIISNRKSDSVWFQPQKVWFWTFHSFFKSRAPYHRVGIPTGYAGSELVVGISIAGFG